MIMMTYFFRANSAGIYIQSTLHRENGELYEDKGSKSSARRTVKHRDRRSVESRIRVSCEIR